jgi:hypothetical protein
VNDVTNTLAYYFMELVTVANSFIVKAPGKARFLDIFDDSGLSKEKEKGMIFILRFFYFSCRKQSLNNKRKVSKRQLNLVEFSRK